MSFSSAVVLVTGGDPSVLAQAALRRGELVMRRADAPALVEVSHFFYGHQLSINGDFLIAGNNGYTPVSVKLISLPDEQGGSEEQSKVPRRPAQYAIEIAGGRGRSKSARRYPLSREGGGSSKTTRLGG